jgi:hypothetical protein
MLDHFDLVGVSGAIIEIGKKILQQLGALGQVRCQVIEQKEILLFFGQQTKHTCSLIFSPGSWLQCENKARSIQRHRRDENEPAALGEDLRLA